MPSPEPVTSRRGFFWVGVERVDGPWGTVSGAPMCVEWEEPVDVTRPYPLVLIHGGGGQGLDWMGTPDGRPGWSTLLVQRGYRVYVVDRPGHGRSSFHPDVIAPMGAPFPFHSAARRAGCPTSRASRSPSSRPRRRPSCTSTTRWSPS